MDVAANSYANILQSQGTPPKPPSASDLASKIMEEKDSDADGLLSIEEIGLSEEAFSNLDLNGDGSVSSDELQESISSMLDGMKNQTTTPEEFGSFLSELGIDVPHPPPPPPPSVSEMATSIFQSSDSDSNGLLSIEELGLTEELFAQFDSDEDGNITQEELENGITALMDSAKSGEISHEEMSEVMAQLGIQGPPPPPPMSASSDEDEEDDVTAVSSVEDQMTEYTMSLVSSLIEALKSDPASDKDEESSDLDLSKFKQLMTMINEQTQDKETTEMLDKFISQI